MTKIEFYLLETSETSVDRFAAKLAQTAFRNTTDVHIHCDDSNQVEKMSELLWSFSQSSFLPNGFAENSPISIGYSAEHAKHFSTLLTFGHRLPQYFSRFETLQWVIANDEQSKAIAREQYRFFKQRGYPLAHHQIQHGQF